MRARYPGLIPAGVACFVAVACGLFLPGSATAVEFRGGQHVVIPADEVILDDLYATGETVTVDGRVEGDLVAAGRQVRLNGEVTGDLIAAGQAVTINGPVGDDARVTGMALELGPAGSVGDDMVAAGFSLETKAGSLVGGSLLFSGFQALLTGDVAEALLGTMSALEIQGGVGADSEVTVEGEPGAPSFLQYVPMPVELPPVAGGLTIADGARIEGELRYTSPDEARGGGANSARLTHQTPTAAQTEAEATAGSGWWKRLFRWLGLIVLGLLCIWWIPGWLDERSGEIQARPLRLTGLGLLGVAALPIVATLALAVPITVAVLLGQLKLGGLAALVVVLAVAAVGLLVLAFWLTSTYLAPLLVGLCTGRWALQRFADDKASGLVLPLTAGVVILALLRSVPIVGWVLGLAVLCLGWGAVLLWLWRRFRPSPPTTAGAMS